MNIYDTSGLGLEENCQCGYIATSYCERCMEPVCVDCSSSTLLGKVECSDCMKSKLSGASKDYKDKKKAHDGLKMVEDIIGEE